VQRAHSGAWIPGELRRRQATLRGVRASVARQRQRLLEAYLAEVIDLACFQRQDGALDQQEADLLAREREVVAQGARLVEVSTITESMTKVLEQMRVGLDQAGFEQRRQLAALLIDRVVVTDGQVEIRYVIPTTPAGTKTQFCHLRTDYFHRIALPVVDCAKLRRPAPPAPRRLRPWIWLSDSGMVQAILRQRRSRRIARELEALSAGLVGPHPIRPGSRPTRATAGHGAAPGCRP